MKEKFKISIIIPVYNTEAHLTRTLDSVCCQDYNNLEIIVVDDGSNDASLQLCEQYQSKDPRIIIYKQDHQGVSAARNLGIAHATGEYIGFVDSDDWIEKDMYSFLLN